MRADNDDGRDSRAALRTMAQANAQRLGSAPPPARGPLIATGHQAWLWHPGILAKDIVAAELARLWQCGWLHLVVDQDVPDALAIDLPRRDGDALNVRRLHLADVRAQVPTGMQPPVDADAVVARLRAAGDERLGTLAAAWQSLPPCRTLAEQVAVVTARLMRPWTGEVPLLMVTQLAALPRFAELVDAALADARACVHHYNGAVAAHPGAGVTALRVEPDRVELPLWVLGWNQPRRRVFADLSDSTPLLAAEDGSEIDRGADTLAPRALLLTALMRGGLCDLFIHGTGGGVYDQAMARWMRAWRGGEANPLAPMAVASADVRLDFDAPIADRADHAHAVWRRHHVPHNVDRCLNLTNAPARRKRALLAGMHDDRDKRRRRAAFDEVHSINAALVADHPQVLAEAEAAVHRSRTGLANRRIARRRDWCFALYPSAKLDALRAALRGTLGER